MTKVPYSPTHNTRSAKLIAVTWLLQHARESHDTLVATSLSSIHPYPSAWDSLPRPRGWRCRTCRCIALLAAGDEPKDPSDHKCVERAHKIQKRDEE